MEKTQENEEVQEKLVDATNLSGGLEILVQLAEKQEPSEQGLAKTHAICLR